MKNQLADIFGKHRTIISTALIGTVLIGGTAFYYKTAFNLTASVTAASCFLTTEIDGKIAEKADLEAQVSSTALAITTTNADITANWQLLIAVNASIAQMSAKVISDYAIGVEKTKVDTVYSQLNDKKALDSLTAQISTAKSALDLTKKASDALSAKLPALKKASDDLNNELASKKELDALLLQSQTAKSSYDNFTQQVSDRKALDAANTALQSAQTAMTKAKAAVSAKIPSTTTTYNNSVTAYNAANKAYSDLLATYNKKYQNDAANLAAITTKANTAFATYGSINAKYTAAFSVYNVKYNKNSQTASDLQKAYDTAFASYNNANSELSNAFGQYQSALNQYNNLNSQYSVAFAQYKSKWTGSTASISDLQKRYDGMITAYNKLLSDNNSLKVKLTSLQNDKATYESKDKELNAKAGDLTLAQKKLETNVLVKDQEINDAKADICPTDETDGGHNLAACSDTDQNGIPIDNDRNGVANCDDSACSGSAACVKDTTTDTNTNIDNNADNNTNTNTDNSDINFQDNTGGAPVDSTPCAADDSSAADAAAAEKERNVLEAKMLNDEIAAKNQAINDAQTQFQAALDNPDSGADVEAIQQSINEMQTDANTLQTELGNIPMTIQTDVDPLRSAEPCVKPGENRVGDSPNKQDV